MSHAHTPHDPPHNAAGMTGDKMNTATQAPPTPAAPQPLPETARLVVTFPLNGRKDSGYAVWIVDETTELERYAITDYLYNSNVIGERPTIAAAVAYCLRGSGWGTYTIAEQVDR